MEFEIISPEQAGKLRTGFIQRFVDTSSEHYQTYIASPVSCSDGLCYIGYLWDCLLDNETYQKECDMETAAAFLKDKEAVFVMWDLFSRERVVDHRRFSLHYPKDTVICMRGQLLGQTVVEEWNAEQDAWNNDCQVEDLWFPEDIYCFDESMSWYVIFTHEGWDHETNPELSEDAYIRICFLNTGL